MFIFVHHTDWNNNDDGDNDGDQNWKVGFLTLLDSGGGGRFAPTITYSRIRGCVCIYRC